MEDNTTTTTTIIINPILTTTTTTTITLFPITIDTTTTTTTTTTITTKNTTTTIIPFVTTTTTIENKKIITTTTTIFSNFFIEVKNQPSEITDKNYINLIIGGKNIISYKYKFDNEDWSAEYDINIPLIIENIKEGKHSLFIMGKSSDNLWHKENIVKIFWIVNINKPLAILYNLPPQVTNVNSINIKVGGRDITHYKYLLNSGEWSNERSIEEPIKIGNLSYRRHTIYVIGKNSNGVWQSINSPTTYSWLISNVEPIAILYNLPDRNSKIVNITVGGYGVVKYSYRIDSGDWSEDIDISRHIIITNLPSGLHKIEVIGIDEMGNRQRKENATTHLWEVE